MFSAYNQHLNGFLLIEWFVYLCHASDVVDVLKWLLFMALDKRHLMADVFDRYEFTCQRTDRFTSFSQVENLFHDFVEVLSVSCSREFFPDSFLLSTKLHTGKIEPWQGFEVFKEVKLMLDGNDNRRSH
jgi:hypothetical protein